MTTDVVQEVCSGLEGGGGFYGRVHGARLLGLVNSSRQQRTVVRSLCMVCLDSAFTGMSGGIRRKRDQGDGSQLGCLRRDPGQPSGGMGQKGVAVNTSWKSYCGCRVVREQNMHGWLLVGWEVVVPIHPPPTLALALSLFLQLYQEVLTSRMGSNL